MNRGLTAKLLSAAAEVKNNARVYSGFHVGAALLTSDGTIVTGCNLELHSTTSSICAERCALAKAVSMGYRKFAAIAIVSDASAPVSPCGFCRQYLFDFDPNLIVIMSNADQSEVQQTTAAELLPNAFVFE